MCHQVISFNLGSMGFLTNHSYKNYAEDILGVINGDQDLGHCAMDQEVRHLHRIISPRDSVVLDHALCWYSGISRPQRHLACKGHGGKSKNVRALCMAASFAAPATGQKCSPPTLDHVCSLLSASYSQLNDCMA